MAKKFNITGTCIPEKHYMADLSQKLEQIVTMVEQGDYFSISRPRQFGKTTIMYLLRQRLLENKTYLALNISFEGIDTPTYQNHELFISTLLDMIKQRLEMLEETEAVSLIEKNKSISTFNGLSTFIRQLVKESGRKIVLMIDEVDKAANNQLFLDFLGMLRTKYLAAREDQDHTFHSVVLASVHDIKTIKNKIRDDSERMFNSPWNIAADFNIKLELTPEEITGMLNGYSLDKKVKIDIPYFAERLYYYTSGYPFLVSSLCKIMDEEIMPHSQTKEWLPSDLNEALQATLTGNNTNFQSLIKNLENNPELYEFVFKIIINGHEFSYNPDNAITQFGMLYGILKVENNKVKIHNRLYEQRIYNFMASNTEISGELPFSPVSSSYIQNDGSLNIEKVIKKFQKFMIKQYSKKDINFIERNGRLLFLAFIKPIINGKGFDFKEVQISEEKRLDIVITFAGKKYIIELKIWRGEAYHREGIRQLTGYLEHQEENTGYLLIYDLRKDQGRAGDWEEIQSDGKEIYAAWI